MDKQKAIRMATGPPNTACTYYTLFLLQRMDIKVVPKFLILWQILFYVMDEYKVALQPTLEC